MFDGIALRRQTIVIQKILTMLHKSNWVWLYKHVLILRSGAHGNLRFSVQLLYSFKSFRLLIHHIFIYNPYACVRSVSLKVQRLFQAGKQKDVNILWRRSSFMRPALTTFFFSFLNTAAVHWVRVIAIDWVRKPWGNPDRKEDRCLKG